MKISVGSRSSPLARAQVVEVKQELQHFFPNVDFECTFVETIGDKDQKTSLRSLDKTDFFTKEVDSLLLSGECRVAIHSAKDLPSPLPAGLSIIAITRGVDPSDALVLKGNITLETLPHNPIIATSSIRREEAVKELIPDASFIDIRGTIQQRLQKLEEGVAHGVVIAEAALIRLGLTHLNLKTAVQGGEVMQDFDSETVALVSDHSQMVKAPTIANGYESKDCVNLPSSTAVFRFNRIKLPGTTTPLQGQLAVMARSDDDAMKDLFASIDCRHKMLYLGIDLPEHINFSQSLTHFPIIKVIPRRPEDPAIAKALNGMDDYTHIIFTSKNAASILMTYVNMESVEKKCLIAVGKQTAMKMKTCGIPATVIAQEETAEGILDALSSLNLERAHIFWPCSSLSRPLISNWLTAQNIKFTACPFYDTVPNIQDKLPKLDLYNEIMFTSPSTVEAFILAYGSLPNDKTLTSIGPVTRKKLLETLKVSA